MPTVSVIIPTYQRANLVKDTERMYVNWLRVKEKAFERNPILKQLPCDYLDKYYYNRYRSVANFYLERGEQDKAEQVLSRYRQVRGYNLSLELLTNDKCSLPPITMNYQKQFIFVHIPKTAGSSIIDALFPEIKGNWGRYKGHYLPEEYTAEAWQKYFTFCFIRNPWDRMVSLYHFWQGSAEQKITFKEFCLNFPQFISSSIGYYHQQKQIDFVYRHDQKIDFIGKFENLAEDFKFICDRFNISTSLPHLVQSQREKDYTSYYDEETRDFVANYFAEDVRLGNYKYEL